MASSFIDCPANQWTLVAANVTTGVIHRVSCEPSAYLQASVPTGDPAPSGRSAGVDAFKDSITGDTSEIKNSTAIDAHLWADGADGRVRVDL